MNKQDIINSVAKSAGLTKADAQRAVDAFCETVKKAMKKGEEVRLIGFGTFKTRNVPAKTVRNPRDGSPVKVKACTRVKFSAGKDLKDAANS
ncbi:MAG: HU family DNA-binding protein [Rickettsiales bacterium]